MIDGISTAADLTPSARVQGAGAAQIYSPPPSPHSSQDILLSRTDAEPCWVSTAPLQFTPKLRETSLILALAELHVRHDYA